TRSKRDWSSDVCSYDLNKTNDNSKIEEDEVHLIEKETEKEDSIPTSTESNENLQKAKEKQENKSSKLSFLGNEVVREYSEKEPDRKSTRLNSSHVSISYAVFCLKKKKKKKKTKHK